MAEPDTTFDEFADGVLQLNAATLDAEREQSLERMQAMPAVSFYFSVKTSHAPNVHEMHGAVNTLNMRDTLTEAWNAAQGCARPGPLPSNNCYIESAHVLETINQYPVDIQFRCRQHDRMPGNLFSGRICGDDGSHNKCKNTLWLLNAGEQRVYGDNDREIFSSKAFVESKTFAMYHHALSFDLDEHTSTIKGANQVEYLSPTCRIRDGEVHRADWFLDVMYRNSQAFVCPVTSISCPLTHIKQQLSEEEANDEDALRSHAISLRMNEDDWGCLKNAVSTSVTGPLRRSIMDLTTEPRLDFLLIPEIETALGADMDSGQSASQRSGSGYWQALSAVMKQSAQSNSLPPKAALKIKMTVRFV